jgi:sRNA-binding protein
MLNRPNPFAETGAASSILALKEDIQLDFVGESQLDITPFQRQMIEAEKARQAEQKKEQQEKARNAGGGGGGRTPNSMNSQSPAGSSHSNSETVRYINENDGDESELSVID